MTHRRVLIALEWVPTYRTGFFELLRNDLSDTGVELSLVHGQAPSNKAQRRTNTTLPWAIERANRRVNVRGTEFCWQPVLREARAADLVIVQQEASLILNLLLALRLRGSRPWALWGHGENFNTHDRSEFGERLKGFETGRADWFFAYTEQSAAAATRMGADPARITVVDNAVDGLQPGGEPSAEIAELVAAARARSKNICWVNSSLDRWKRIDFLCAVTDELRSRCPDFELFVLGDGEERARLETHARDRPWIHVVGPTFGADKREIGSAASLMLHPGLVGLHVVEAFQFGTPLITTAIDYHSHEISYLTSGSDGLVLPADISAADYAEAVMGILADGARLGRMSSSATSRAAELTVDNMARRFAAGVRSALALTS